MKLSLVRRILIGFLGLYLLGLLHASITLFQSEGKIEGETSRRPVRHTAPLKRRHGAMHPTMSQTIGNASNHSFPKNASENIYGRVYGRKRRGRTSRREQKIKEKKTWLETAEQKELLLPKPIFVMGFPKVRLIIPINIPFSACSICFDPPRLELVLSSLSFKDKG